MLQHETIVCVEFINQLVQFMQDFLIGTFCNFGIAFKQQANRQITQTVSQNIHLWTQRMIVFVKIKEICVNNAFHGMIPPLYKVSAVGQPVLLV